jgi:hypothetical protein
MPDVGYGCNDFACAIEAQITNGLNALQLPSGILNPCAVIGPSGTPDPAAQIQANITQVQQYIASVADSDPGSVLPSLLGFLWGAFQNGGQWDYKYPYTKGTLDYTLAQYFGNFDFGAVLAGLGFSYYISQSAAGTYQMWLCANKGSCGQGIPFVTYPFGDQVSDAQQIQAGFTYETKCPQD